MRVEDCLAVITREAAWRWIVDQFLPEGPKCPSCGSAIASEKAVATFFGLKRTWCKRCGHVFTPTAGSPIQETSWQPEEFAQLVILHLFGRQAVEIAQHLGKSASTVRDMLVKVEALRPLGAPTLFSMPYSQGIKRARRGGGGGDGAFRRIPTTAGEERACI